jgi:SAM-dependent methyltransferase
MTALTLADGSLAAVVSFYALIHIPRSVVPVALSEMHRVLAPGGSVLIAVHGGQGTLHATKMLEQPCALDATLFTLPELCAMVSAAGFSITEAHERDPVEEELTTPRLYLWATSGN